MDICNAPMVCLQGNQYLIFMQKFILIFACAVLFMPAVAFGAIACGGAGNPPCSPLGTVMDTETIGTVNHNQTTGQDTIFTSGKFVDTIISLVSWFSWFIAVAAVVMGLYSGWLFITARDNAQQITAAQKTMLYAVIGIGVAIIAFGIIAITKSLLSIV